MYQSILWELRQSPSNWLVTGVAGFIGSNLLEILLKNDQKVVGLDNFSTGHKANLEEVRSGVSNSQWNNFQFIEGDIRNLKDCMRACNNIDYVLHQAALGSVPRSIADPITSNKSNIDGFLNMLVAARDSSIQKFVYAASSSTYGDHPALPKLEKNIGKPLSPYAVTKLVNELYADVFSKVYALNSIGLRYFNVFGPRQDPLGSYAAVIPTWITALLNGNDVVINGDGETSRDFSFIDNVVQANILAAKAELNEEADQIYNVAVGEKTTLNQLYEFIVFCIEDRGLTVSSKLTYQEFRPGDVRHSEADISKARKLLGYEPIVTAEQGISMSVRWYIEKFKV